MAIEQPAFADVGAGGADLQVLGGIAEAAAAGCGEQYNRLAGEIVGLEEGVYDRRRRVPPNRKTEKDHVVSGDLCVGIGHGDAERLVLHLYGTARFFVRPVEVVIGVRDGRADLVKVGPGGFGQVLGGGTRDAAGGKISDQFFAHERTPSFR